MRFRAQQIRTLRQHQLKRDQALEVLAVSAASTITNYSLNIAEPPLTDSANGFAWPDTELGVVKTNQGYAFFGSDGAFHARQNWEEQSFGNDKYGSVTRTLGTG